MGKSKKKKDYIKINPLKLNRVEIIDETGRAYVNWHSDNKVDISIQDEERTIKIFIKR